MMRIKVTVQHENTLKMLIDMQGEATAERGDGKFYWSKGVRNEYDGHASESIKSHRII